MQILQEHSGLVLFQICDNVFHDLPVAITLTPRYLCVQGDTQGEAQTLAQRQELLAEAGFGQAADQAVQGQPGPYAQCGACLLRLRGNVSRTVLRPALELLFSFLASRQAQRLDQR